MSEVDTTIGRLIDFTSETHLELIGEIGFATRQGLAVDEVLACLHELHDHYSEFRQVEVVKSGQKVALRSYESGQEPESSTEISLVVEGLQKFRLLWGDAAGLAMPDFARSLFTFIGERVALPEGTLAYTDFRLYASSELALNHHAVVHRALRSNSRLAHALSPASLYRGGIDLSAVLEDDVTAHLMISSNVSESEVKRGVYSDDRMTVFVAIGRVNVAPNPSLGDVVAAHVDVALEYMRDRFVPHVFRPLDDELARASDSQE